MKLVVRVKIKNIATEAITISWIITVQESQFYWVASHDRLLSSFPLDVTQ